MEKLTGKVDGVTFHSSETGYCVFKVETPTEKLPVTVVAYGSRIKEGILVDLTGTWSVHKRYGRQFQAETVTPILPTTAEGIERFLASGIIKGVGPHTAKLLVSKFGLGVFQVIEKKPEELRSLKGVGRSRAKNIAQAWIEQKAVGEILSFLHSYGVTASQALRIHKKFGESSVAKISENPYRLTNEISGIGFKTADSIAKKMGILGDAPIRVRAGISWLLGEKTSNGHVAYPKENLIAEAAKLLDVAEAQAVDGINAELVEGNLIEESIEGTQCVFLKWLHHCEVEVARRLKNLSRGSVPWGEIDSKLALAWAEERLGIDLDADQKKAIELALHSKVLVITGGPGTGKTTITRAIVNILQKRRVSMQLCSPTGRAAKRLSECTGMEARTIHRLLGYAGYGGSFDQDESNPLECDRLIVDETSMLDLSLMRSVLRALQQTASLLLIGDVDQLPSVGPGCVLKSAIESGVLPVVRLTQVFRQAAESDIVSNAHRINSGVLPDLAPKEKTDFYFVESNDALKTVSLIQKLVKERIPAKFQLDPVSDVQVLAPMNRGTLGSRHLNSELQKILNPNPRFSFERFGQIYGQGDKVMVIENDYEKDVFNGDIGRISQVDLEGEGATIDFDGRKVAFGFDEMRGVTLAYAATIHKSQGSEYPAVVLPLSMQHFVMLRRNLIYTGVTRARKLVVIVGERRALETAIHSHSEDKRWNKLAERLREL